MFTGELLYEASVPLAVSVNGQDFTQVPGGYRYFTPPAAPAVSPASGPADGGTLVTIGGFGLGGPATTQLECRFHGEVVNATVVNSTTVKCISPTLPPPLDMGGNASDAGGDVAANASSASPVSSVPLLVTLNGVWELPGTTSLTRPLNEHGLPYGGEHGVWEPTEAVAALPWLLRSPPVVSGVLPVSGPLAGGTLVSVHGFAIADGVDYRCRFGSRNRTIAATYDTITSRLRCVAPA